MCCFDSTLNKRNANSLIFWLRRKQFWKFRSHTEQIKEAQQGKLILSFNVLGLEIAFSLENEQCL